MEKTFFKAVFLGCILLVNFSVFAQKPTTIGPHPSSKGEFEEAVKEVEEIKDTDEGIEGKIDTNEVAGRCAKPGYWYKSIREYCKGVEPLKLEKKTEMYIHNEEKVDGNDTTCVSILVTIVRTYKCDEDEDDGDNDRDGKRLEISNQNTPVGLKLFPNPVSVGDNITFSLPSFSVNNVTVYDLTGKNISNVRIGNSGSDLVTVENNLSTGTYVIRIEAIDLNGNTVIQSSKLTVVP